VLRIIAFVALAMVASQPVKAQLYVGAGVGMFLFDSTVQTTTTKLVDQGGDAPDYVLFAGYDHRFENGLFVGGEILGGVTAGRSRLVLNGQDYTVEVPVFTETVVRLGWRTRGNSAFYMRLGAMLAEVSEGGRTSWRGAPLIGFGAEVPFRGGFYAGAEVSWTDLDGLEIWQGRIRIGYRF
jgi:hypothetical protein